MSEEKKQLDRPKTITELFFHWLSDFTLPIVKDKWGIRIIAAGIALGIASYSVGVNADNITRIVNIFLNKQ